jgi:hypothetical protein
MIISTPLEERVCVICNKTHDEKQKWLRVPNKYFPKLVGLICKKHYHNELTKEWSKNNLTGNPEFREKQNKYNKEKYQSDPEYREKVRNNQRKGGKNYETILKSNRKKNKLEKNKIKARERKKKEYDKNPEKYRSITLSYAATLGRLWTYLKARAKRSKIEVTLTFEEFSSIRTSGVCVYCKKPINSRSVGIDRKDSTLGYISGNCVCCCGDCNREKGRWVSFDEMMMFHQILRGEITAPLLQKYSIYANLFRKGRLSNRKRWSRLLKLAKRENIPVTLTYEEYIEIISKPCEYCGGPNSKSGYGLDKIVPGKEIGYTFINSVSCCPVCNDIKGSLLTKEQMHLMVAVIAYHRVDIL